MVENTTKSRSQSLSEKSPAFRLVDYLPYHLTVATNQVSLLIAKTYHARYGISIWQWRILCTLGAEGPMTAQDIVSLSAMDKTTVSRAIQALKKRGIVTKTRSKTDSRAFDVHLTRHGEEMYAEIIPLALGYQDDLLSDLTENDREKLLVILQQVTNKARKLAEEQ